MHPIPQWAMVGGQVEARRDAEHWIALDGGAVRCDLCYRACTLAPGEAGWCGYRANVEGRMALRHHGELSVFYPWLFGYGVGALSVYPGMLLMGVGATHCTASCKFCYVSTISRFPERLPWAFGPRQMARGAFYGLKAMVHPAGVVRETLACGAQGIALSYNEPLLSFEYTRDLFALARAAGLVTVLLTNGFCTEAAARAIAPLCSYIKVGIKGSLDEAFYAGWMRSAGAPAQVRRSLELWRGLGVRVGVDDLLAAPHMQDNAAFERAAASLYPWLAEVLGPDGLITIGRMAAYSDDLTTHSLITKRAGADEVYNARQLAALDAARAAGLHYIHSDRAHLVTTITCRHCGGALVARAPVRMDGAIAVYRPHEQHASGGRCDHCGGAVPVLTLPAAQVRENLRRYLLLDRGEETIRIEW